MQVDDGGSGSGRRVDEPCDDEDEPMAPDHNLNSFFAGVSESHSQVSIKLWAMGLTLNNSSRFLQPFRLIRRFAQPVLLVHRDQGCRLRPLAR